MAHIDDGGGKGRPTNVDVNIVPFIDLMSVLVIFLLITAVWTQVSMIQIGSSVYGQKTSDEDPKPPPRAEIPFRLDIKRDGHAILLGKKYTPINKNAQGEYDYPTLIEALKRVKELYPEKVDAVVTMNDELKYEFLIGGMDALLQSGFPQISIATGSNE